MKLTFNEQQMSKLDQAKARTGTPKSEIIRGLVDAYIDEEGQIATIEQQTTVKESEKLPLQAQTTILGNPIKFPEPKEEKDYKEKDFSEIATNGWSERLFSKIFGHKPHGT